MRRLFRFAIGPAALLLVMSTGASSAEAASITLTGVVRDFLAAGTPAGTYNGHAGVGHPDFECCLGTDLGIVMATLGGDGLPVYAGTAGNPTTHGATAFDQWYRDTAGVNTSFSHSITLTETSPGSGIYSYSNGAFFPADGLGFADSPCCGHNYEFTYQLATSFTYAAGQSFTFTGDDDVWVFINDALVIDLGGVHGALSATVSLDTLGLTAGSTYDLDVFFAERHTSASSFRIDTSIASIVSQPTSSVVPEPGTLVLLGTGICLAIARRVRRRGNR